jgi:hypothetical protein
MTRTECCARTSVFQPPEDRPPHPASAADRNSANVPERATNVLIVTRPEPALLQENLARIGPPGPRPRGGSRGLSASSKAVQPDSQQFRSSIEGEGANERNSLGIGGFLTKHTWPAMWQFCNRPNGSGGLNENTRARSASPQNFVERL